MIVALSRCGCGTYPWEAPLGEFCADSDPTDPSFHDFLPIAVGETATASNPPGAVAVSRGGRTYTEQGDAK